MLRYMKMKVIADTVFILLLLLVFICYYVDSDADHPRTQMRNHTICKRPSGQNPGQFMQTDTHRMICMITSVLFVIMQIIWELTWGITTRSSRWQNPGQFLQLQWQQKVGQESQWGVARANSLASLSIYYFSHSLFLLEYFRPEVWKITSLGKRFRRRRKHKHLQSIHNLWKFGGMYALHNTYNIYTYKCH